jgi:putative tricarboxylic transport membrane protein
MLLSQGNVGIFWSNPLVASIVTLALVMLFWPILSALWGRVGRRPAAGVSPGQ